MIYNDVIIFDDLNILKQYVKQYKIKNYKIKSFINRFNKIEYFLNIINFYDEK